jgi:hypothetical protein
VTSLNFALDSPLGNGIYLSRYPVDHGSIYQLAFLPSQALQLQAQRKVAILFDYLAGKSTVTTSEVLNGVKTMLREQFTPADSFNLIFSNLAIRRAGEKWFAAHPAVIDQAFANAGATYYNNGGRSYYGNEYFYQNLTQRTYGNYANIRASKSFSGMLTGLVQTLAGFVDSFDFYTTLENGYCFGRYNLGATGSTIYLNRPILQLGKFNGSFYMTTPRGIG